MRRGRVRRATGRRGVTLLEMLVVVALVVLMMLILASIFQAATGAMTSMRTYQELDDSLRLLDLTIRQDLAGTTATMTPPNNPQYKTGYFEYGENAPSDGQGEDTDDYIAFTTKAPEGRVFTGRIWVPFNYGTPITAANPNGPGLNLAVQPVTVTSQYAEIIYFLRNGNLYRRVLLVMPERKGAIAVSGVAAAGLFFAGQFQPNIINNGTLNPSAIGAIPVGWYGVNDISVRPNEGPDSGNIAQYMPIPNDLGDLTNREHRAFRQRCARDLFDAVGLNGNAPGTSGTRDGLLDDVNLDLLPDYYPTLTGTQVAALEAGNTVTAGGTPLLINDSSYGQGVKFRFQNGSYADLYAFPFIFPGMYSKPETASLDANNSPPIGLLHAIDPTAAAGIVTVNGTKMRANQAPVEFGDSLAHPSAAQSWWGFPTFRETASKNWHDPIFFPGVNGPSNAQGHQVQYLQSFTAGVAPSLPFNGNFLPAVGSQPPQGIPVAPATPYGFDGAGNPTLVGGAVQSTNPLVTLTVGINVTQATTAEQLSYVWDDDLIMTGVRSFDVKALDLNAPTYSLPGDVYSAGYYDLGYAASDYVQAFGNTSLVTSTPSAITDGAYGNINGIVYGNPLGFGHEGRMPPNSQDLRLDPQRPILNSGLANNVGDDSPGLNRLRRVWDSWSTDYSQAPQVDVNLRGSPIQASPLDRPVYPSYPAPYPQPLRGLQIQIRVVDPKNEKVKVLTIHQDFSDKL